MHISGQKQRDLEDQVAAVRKVAANYESEVRHLTRSAAVPLLSVPCIHRGVVEQIEDMKQRIGEAQQLSYKFKLDAGQKATDISQLRLKLCELASEKQVIWPALCTVSRR